MIDISDIYQFNKFWCSGFPAGSFESMHAETASNFSVIAKKLFDRKAILYIAGNVLHCCDEFLSEPRYGGVHEENVLNMCQFQH